MRTAKALARLRINGCSSEPSLCAHEISIKISCRSTSRYNHDKTVKKRRLRPECVKSSFHFTEPSLCAHEINIKSLVDLLADITMIKLSKSGGSDQSVHK